MPSTRLPNPSRWRKARTDKLRWVYLCHLCTEFVFCVLIFTPYYHTKFQHLSLYLQVDFNSSKNELSTKKIRRKAEKAMKKEVIVQLDG